MEHRVVVSVDKIIELYTSGKSIATVAANLNVSRKVVKNRLVKSGVNIRSAGKPIVGIGSYPGRTTFYNLISDDVPNCFRYKLNFKINGVENE